MIFFVIIHGIRGKKTETTRLENRQYLTQKLEWSSRSNYEINFGKNGIPDLKELILRRNGKKLELRKEGPMAPCGEFRGNRVNLRLLLDRYRGIFAIDKHATPHDPNWFEF